MFYAALDMSLRSVAVCIIDHEGKVQLERSVPSEVPDLVRCLTEFGEPIHQVGLEAGTLTQHLTYGLVEAGYDVVCMEARQVNAALSAMRNKTDKHDARGIAQILRAGWYSRVHVKSLESHHTRALLTSRKVMQRKCIDPRTMGWMKPQSSAAPSSASKSEALQTLIPCMRAAAPLNRGHQTAKRSVTRENDRRPIS